MINNKRARAEHTPGPWHVDPDMPIDVVANVGDDERLATAFPIDGDNEDMETATANARLIAAAPDLLEACRILLAGAESEGWDRARGTDEPRTGIAEVRAAIAKAEGRQ